MADDDTSTLEQVGAYIDDAIASVAPGWAEKRQLSRLRSQAYEALQNDVFDESIYNLGGSGDRFVQPTQLKRLRRRGRGLMRNNFIINGLFEFWATQILGDKLQVSAETDDHRFNRDVERNMNRWMEVKCDIRHQHTLLDLCRMSMKTLGSAGGMLFGHARGGKLTYAEPEQIVTPYSDKAKGDNRVWNGIEVNQDGAPQAYHVAPWGSRGLNVDSSKAVRWPARKAYHLYNPMRLSQSRGVPLCTPMMILSKHGKDFLDTEVIRAQVAACFSVVRKTAYPGQVSRGGRELKGRDSQDEENADRPPVEENVRPGGITDLMAGEEEELMTLDPSTPVSAVGDFMGTLSRFAMFVLGIPVEALFFTDATYSGGRLARLVAQRQFKFWQQWMKDHLLRQVYRWKVLQWINMDARKTSWGIRPPEGEESPFRHSWYLPQWPWVDPKKEEGANQIGRLIGDVTLPELIRKKGNDPEKVTAEKERFISHCKKIARESDEMEEDDWRLLYMGVLSFKEQPFPNVESGESE